MLRALGALWAVALAAVPCGWSAPAVAAPSPAAAHDEGTWDLTFEKGNRRCRLFLRSEAHGQDYALAMPTICHKAFPALATVSGWEPAPGEHVVFKTGTGATVFDFGPDGSAALSATVGDNDVYQLTPISPALQETLRSAATPDLPAALEPAPSAAATDSEGVLVDNSPIRPKKLAGKAASPPAPYMPPTSPGQVAGNYAVLRNDRDTGCMVTLEPSGGGPKGDLRARLAPACRDQGIVIFDPAGWTLLHGTELRLTARRGHSTALTRRDERTWANAPARGAALVLKRL